MDISRNNYETYFLDFLEGNLQPDEEGAVLEFVENNPDLKSELDLMRSLYLTPDDSISFSDANSLKKEFIPTAEINPGNVDDFLAAKLEGDLDDISLANLEEFLELNPEYQKEWQRMTMTRLVPEPGIEYPDHRSLKKSALFLIPGRVRFGIIASLAALLILFIGVRIVINSGENINVPRSREYLEPISLAIKTSTTIELKQIRSRTKIIPRTSKGKITPIYRNENLAVNELEIVSGMELHFDYPDRYSDLANLEIYDIDTETATPDPPERKGSVFGRVVKKLVSPITKLAKTRQEDNDNSVDFWRIANLGVKGYNLAADKELELKTIKDSQGRVVEYSLVEEDYTLIQRERSSKE
jgi:hypothetical protein